jgi:ornithine carbamoyltransferase
MAAIAEVLERHKDWICDEKRMERVNQDGIYMHCLPAATGYEVAPEVIDGPRSAVYDQAENVLHMAKAIMVKTM